VSPLSFLLGERWPARILLVAGLSAFYAGTILINNELLFPFADVGGSVFWFFFPEGIKLLLVMSLGLRGAAAAGLGRAAVTLNQYPSVSYGAGLSAGLAMSLATLLALKIGSKVTKKSFPWAGIKYNQMLIFSFIIAIVDAAAKIYVEIYFIGNDIIKQNNLYHSLFVEAFGRLFGSMVFLYFVKLYISCFSEDRAPN
jgi:hypothetical protein